MYSPTRKSRYRVTAGRIPVSITPFNYELGRQTPAASVAYAIALADSVYGWPDLSTIVERVGNAPDNRFESADHLIEHTRQIVDASKAKISPFFLSLPNTPAVVELVPEHQRASGDPAYYYYEAPGAAGEPGVYRITPDFWETMTVGEAEILAVHEVWPGHHLEAATTIGDAEQHPITKLAVNSGFGEGWAIYAEHVAEEANILHG